jgi:hypothetical protein
VDAVLDVFNVLHEPTAVFTRLRERPRILAPWLVVSAFAIVLTLLTRPYQTAAMDALRATLPPEQAVRMGGGNSLVGLLAVPLGTLIGLAIGAGLLWIGSALTGATGARYKTLMSVLAYSSITYVMFGAITLAVLMVRGVGAVGSFEDLRAPIGLDLLIPSAGLFLGTVLNAINPFSVWGVWMCGTGIAVTQGTSRTSGIVVTAVIYLVCLLLLSTPLLLLGMALKR